MQNGLADDIDRVFGFAQGSFAEHLVADWKNLLPIPKGLSFEHASVVPLYVTSSIQCRADNKNVYDKLRRSNRAG